MMTRARFFLLATVMTGCAHGAQPIGLPQSPPPQPIAWEPWHPDTFADATRQDRLVLVYMEAVWCHWCHVMDDKTYGDAEVQQLIHASYLPIKVDSDARPDLAARYQRWAWPATIIMRPDGTELRKLKGFVAPDRFAATLRDALSDRGTSSDRPVVADGDAEAHTATPALDDAVRSELLARHARAFDPEFGSLRTVKKFLDQDSVLYDLGLAAAGDAAASGRARRTLDGARALIDTEQGGAYQYSHGGNWENPHFEKIMRSQRTAAVAYAAAYTLWRHPEDLAAARAVARFLTGTLRSPEGSFYTSQDADHVATGGGVDTHRYARENGWAIQALIAVGDAASQHAAERAADWVLAHRRWDGGFRHGAPEDASHGGPFLSDTVAMGRALTELAGATDDGDRKRRYLHAAEEAARFIVTRFIADRPLGEGLPSSAASDLVLQPEPDIDEHLDAVAFATALYRVSPSPAARRIAEHTLAWLTRPDIALRRFTEIGIVLRADDWRAAQ